MSIWYKKTRIQTAESLLQSKYLYRQQKLCSKVETYTNTNQLTTSTSLARHQNITTCSLTVNQSFFICSRAYMLLKKRICNIHTVTECQEITYFISQETFLLHPDALSFSVAISKQEHVQKLTDFNVIWLTWTLNELSE